LKDFLPDEAYDAMISKFDTEVTFGQKANILDYLIKNNVEGFLFFITEDDLGKVFLTVDECREDYIKTYSDSPPKIGHKKNLLLLLQSLSIAFKEKITSSKTFSLYDNRIMNIIYKVNESLILESKILEREGRFDTEKIKTSLDITSKLNCPITKRAIEKLYLSLLGKKISEKILDLSICLEILLMTGTGDNNFKISTVMAMVCKESKDDRYRVSKITKEFYGYRSSLVHEGKGKKISSKFLKDDEKNPEFLYREVLGYTLVILEKIFNNNGRPDDWNKVVFNNGKL
jgi:hypothetical protein